MGGTAVVRPHGWAKLGDSSAGWLGSDARLRVMAGWAAANRLTGACRRPALSRRRPLDDFRQFDAPAANHSVSPA
jgi:hypothetical protein